MINDIVPVNQELWMRDSDTKTCMNCELIFTTFRRRHHCRYCGFIFCGKCTIKKKEIVRGQNLKRICTKCYNNLVIKRMNSISTPHSANESPSAVNSFHRDQKQESNASSDEDCKSSRVYTSSNDVPHEVEQILLEMNKASVFDEFQEEFISKRAMELLVENGLNEEFRTVVVDLVRNAVRVVCPSLQFRGDMIDISRYIKLKRITYSNCQISTFFPGVAFCKNLANKKMLKSIQNPKILLIKDISEGSNSEKALVSMDKLIDQEVSLTGITLKKILSIGPKIIICNKGLPQQFLNELAKSNITAIINVKKKTMETIARATQGKVLNNTDEIHHERNFLGQCHSFFQDSKGESLMVHFTGLNDPSLLGTILISSPALLDLKPVKKVIRTLLVEYRNTKLEASFFQNFSLNLTHNPFTELRSQNMQIKHLVISENKMCIKPDSSAVEFYKQKDMTLGEFIMMAAEKSDQKCSDCGCSWGAHTLYYVKAQQRIRVGFSKWTLENKTNDIYMTRECKVCGKGDSAVNQVSRSVWEYSFFKFLNNFFMNSKVKFDGSKCKHLFFETSKFIFHVKGLKITIFHESYTCYNIVPCVATDQSKFFSEALESTLTLLKAQASSLIEKILIRYRDTCNQIIKEIGEEKAEVYEDIIRNFSLSLEKVNNRFVSLLKTINDFSSSQFSNYLEVEKTRKKVFINILELRQALIQSYPIFTRGRKKDRGLIDTVSSSGDSSGDRRASPATSFISDEDAGRIRRESTHSRIDKHVKEDILTQPEFYYLQQGNITLPNGVNDLVMPVEESDLMSIIAYSLNSNEYFTQVLYNIPSSKDLDKVESELLHNLESHFQINFTTYDEDYFKDLAGKDSLNAVYGNHITFNVHVFYPRQFQIIRDKIFENRLEVVQGLISSRSEKEQLGKSKASFFKSNNGLFILKVVDEKEFQMFKELAPNYFKHFCSSEFHNMPSLMSRTLGCYRIYIKNHTKGKSKTKWVLLNEQLGHSMPKEIEVYDLKGSFNHRRQVAAGEKKTKMDRNFLEDFGGLPLMISKESKKLLEISVFNDSLFLSKNKVVDYSLLLAVSKVSNDLSMGIIDYIAKYTFEKAIEHKYKKVVGTDNPTITKPEMYKKRFRESIANYFFIGFEDD